MDSLVIFDCDGVLVDSEIISCFVDAEVFNSYGVSLTGQEIVEGYAGLSTRDIVNKANREFGKNIDAAAFAEACRNKVMARFEKELKPVPGIAAVVAGAMTKRCVCSSSRRERVLRSLAITGLKKYFSDVFTAEEVSRGKPAPDLFLHGAAKLGVAPERCLVIEDSPFGIMGAKEAGMGAIGFTAGSHCTEKRVSALEDAGADLVIDNAQQLLAEVQLFLKRMEQSS